MVESRVFGWNQLIALINSVAVCIGVGLAFWGIGKWRAEQIGKRQCELAEEALALLYEAQWIFDHVRSPFSFQGEGATRRGGEVESPSVCDALNLEFVPLERLNAQGDYFSKVLKLYPRCKAIFGKQPAEPIEEILKIRGEIIHAARMLSHYCKSNSEGGVSDAIEHRRQARQKYEAIKWKGADEADAIDSRLTAPTEKFEKQVSPLLRSRYRISQ